MYVVTKKIGNGTVLYFAGLNGTIGPLWSANKKEATRFTTWETAWDMMKVSAVLPAEYQVKEVNE